jgi:EAL domain-containing protein (putative c-di-GMP-specific phosphodiesterase class I)
MDLIRNIHQHEMKRKIVRSMVQLCHDMGKAIIGEGVEISEEADVLVELECDYLQGFLCAKPGRAFPHISIPPASR